jgi:hypothetical protein
MWEGYGPPRLAAMAMEKYRELRREIEKKMFQPAPGGDKVKFNAFLGRQMDRLARLHDKQLTSQTDLANRRDQIVQARLEKRAWKCPKGLAILRHRGDTTTRPKTTQPGTKKKKKQKKKKKKKKPPDPQTSTGGPEDGPRAPLVEAKVIAPATDTQQGATRQQKNLKKRAKAKKKKKKKPEDESLVTTSQTTVLSLDRSTHLSPTIAHVQELPCECSLPWRLEPVFFNKTLTPQNVSPESTQNASLAPGSVISSNTEEDVLLTLVAQTIDLVVFALDRPTHLSPTIAYVQELPCEYSLPWRLEPVFFNKTLTPQNVSPESTQNTNFVNGDALDASCSYN